MKVKRIEITPHARSPVGSFAVIKLIGISRLEGPATFRLEPMTEAGEPPPLNWLHGDLKPIGVRAGSGTVELLIGPEIVKAESLQPGTHVRFLMSSVEADASVEWPDLSGRHAVDLGNGRTSPPPASSLDQTGNALASATAPASTTEPTGATRQGLARLQSRATVAHPPGLPAETAELKLAPDAGLGANAKSASAFLGFRERTEAQQVAVAERQASSWLPLALGVVIVAAMLITFLRTTTVEGSGVTLFSALHAAMTGREQTAAAGSNSSSVLGEILEVGSTSPAGVDATGMTQREALERANKLLGSVKTPTDRLEVAFWLRKALSRSLSEPRLVWAVTQLGTAYASTDQNNKPNYDAARLLWAWAADAGDAQASCFLGRLYERGLGVPLNPKQARENYVRAGRLGGCPGLDRAMLRVKGEP